MLILSPIFKRSQHFIANLTIQKKKTDSGISNF